MTESTPELMTAEGAPDPKPIAGDSIISSPETNPSQVVTVPMGIASEKLTDEHKHRFWEIAKTDLMEALEWLRKELSKI